jgi:hypothetical protein
MLTDWGAHHIDIAQWALDMDTSGPVRFNDFKYALPSPSELYNTATTFRFTCTYANGVKMEIGNEEQIPHGITFEGEDGKSIHVKRESITFTPKELSQEKIRDGEIRLYESRIHEGNFIDCIYSGKPTAAPVETAHRTITVAHLGNIAMRLGRESLSWDPAKEQVAGDAKAHAMLSRPMRAPWSLG